MAPGRRPSASVGHTTSSTPAASSSAAVRTHRSNDSQHHAFTAQATPYSSSSTSGLSHQQKVIQVLVNRLKNKLPCHSGLELPLIENDSAIEETISCLVELSRDSLDVIALALTELLDKLPKQADVNVPRTIDVLQSQLFVLKVLSVAMASRWHRYADEARLNNKGKSTAPFSAPESPIPSTAGRANSSSNSKTGSGRQATSSDHLASPSGWTEPPPLDDNCAKYILSLMIVLLRQTSPPEGRLMSSANLSFEATFHDFESIELDEVPAQPSEFFDVDLPPVNADGTPVELEANTNGKTPRPQKPIGNNSSTSVNSGGYSTMSIPQLNVKFEKTHKILAKSYFSLNSLILKFAGRIVYHLSASNWLVVFHKIKWKIAFLTNTTEDNPDIVDLHLMKHSALDKTRLVQILQELGSQLINMKREAKVAVAIPLRTACWNWIDLFPVEFNEALRSLRRMDSAPERVFDLLWDQTEPTTGTINNAKAVWPTLAVLGCISAERMRNEFSSSIVAPGQSKHNMAKFMSSLLKHGESNSKLKDVAIVCCLDVCRGAIRVRPEGDLPIISLAYDIMHDVKNIVLKYYQNRPFWESTDEIDVAMFADALVALYRFTPLEDSMVLLTTCLEPERSDAVKLCVVKALITLTTEGRVLPWQNPVEPLYTLAHRFRNIFKFGGVRRTEIDANGTLRRTAYRPKAKRFTAETVADRELLLIGILHLWKTSVAWSFTDFTVEEVSEWMPIAMRVWEEQTDSSVQYAISMALFHVGNQVGTIKKSDPLFELGVAWQTVGQAAAMRTVALQMLHTRMDQEKQRMWAEIGHALILLYIRDLPEDTVFYQTKMAESRVPALALMEIASAVCLASADSAVSRLSAHNLRVIALAERMVDVKVHEAWSEEDRVKRFAAYEQIGDPKIIVTGRVAWQKRLRKHVRTMISPTPFTVAIWEECYYRWCALTELVIRAPLDPLTADGVQGGHVPTGDKSLSLEEQQHSWQNLTLMLAACGSVCLEEQHEPESLQGIIPAELLPDSMRVLRDPRELITTFVTYLIDLLISDSIMAREISKEALGTELSPKLYGKLFRHLDEVIQDITQGSNLDWSEHFAIFLDQFIAVLKLLVENTQASDDLLAVDMTPTLNALAGFITRFGDPASWRVRLKFCQLCDSVYSRTDMLALRKESTTRQQVLDVVMDWIQDPQATGDPELARLQHEVNIASLKAAVHFMDRLQLRPMDGSGSDESGHVVSRLFIRYSNLILRLLDFARTDAPQDDGLSEVSSFSHRTRLWQRDVELRDLVIEGLARLISANTESGVKHSLPLAYDGDTSKRIIFAHVFARVMGQGATFESAENSAILGSRSRLCELVKGPDMVLVLAICETCPPGEIDQVIPVLLNIFDTRTSLMNLMKVLVDREIARTENEAELFRGNSSCTRLLSAFARIHGYTYLRSLLIPLIKTMTTLPPGRGYELDPSKAGDQDVKQNQKNVELVASSFLEIISASVPALPSMFRELCAHIGKAVNQVWPEAKFAALGAFIFLRFISPAVVAPDIVDVEIPKDDGGIIRRGLMVIAKIIQNLANNIFFGKEAYMVALNDFLGNNIINVTRFLSELNKYNPLPGEEEPEEWTGLAYDDTDTIVLHRFFEKHADKVGKELLSLSKPSAEGDSSAIKGQQAWASLCSALVDLGAPIEIPRLSILSSSQHRDYLELLNRNDRHSVSSVREIFVETFTDKDEPAVFVLFASKLDVETVDIELLLYHIFKTLTAPAYENRMFDIIIDWTSFSSSSQVPFQWLKYCVEMFPADVRSRFLTTYFLNPNAAAHKYLRRLYNITAGLSLCSEVRACSSTDELQHYVPATCVAPLVYATSLEQESNEEIPQITMRHSHHIRIPVTMHVGNSHIRITSDKTQPISQTLACKTVEIIPLSEVSDVYNVSTGHDPSEFIIRKARNAVTMYFSSPVRDHIVKSIRAAKSRMRPMPFPGTERFSRLSNVSAALLHIAFLNMGVDEDELRGASYELLSSVVESFNLTTTRCIWAVGSTLPVLSQMSERISNLVPYLTLDFISEIVQVMEKAGPAQRLHCLTYMCPWLKNLSNFVDPTHPNYDHASTKLRDCIRALIEATLNDVQGLAVSQKLIWTEIAKADAQLISLALDELMRAAIDGGIGSSRCESIALIMMPLSSINVRGQILSKMRKALGKTSVKPTKNLADNAHWNEIASLARLALVASQQVKQPILSNLYVPEVIHMVTLIAATGDSLIRCTVWGLIVDLVNSQWITRPTDPASPEIRLLFEECSDPKTLRLFGLHRASRTSELIAHDPKNDQDLLDNQDGLTRFLLRVMECCAQPKGLLNVWRARWMSLVTSTAFQVSPAIQSRAFVVLGTLATTEVDDDFFYQMLVAFKTALQQSSGESDTASVVSMLRCLRNVVPGLVPDSRYLAQVFWLAVALLQSSYMAFFNEAALLLRETLESLYKQGLLLRGVSVTLLDHRSPLEEVACQLDQLLGVSFDSSFSFSLAAIIFKGLRHPPLRDAAIEALRTLLRVSARAVPEFEVQNEGVGSAIVPDALGYFLALLPVSTTISSFRELLSDANADAYWQIEDGVTQPDDSRVPRVPFELLGITDQNTAVLSITFIGTMLANAQGDDAETEIIMSLLADLALNYPEIVSLIYEGLQDKIQDTFANSSKPAILSATSSVFHMVMLDPTQSNLRGSVSTLSTVDETGNGNPSHSRHLMLALEELGMAGLANNFSFLPPNRPQATRKIIDWISELVLRIIE